MSRKALQLAPDASTPDHQVYVALEDALNGRTSGTVALLIQIDPEDLDDVPRLFFVFAETLASVQRAAPPIDPPRLTNRERKSKKPSPTMRQWTPTRT